MKINKQFLIFKDRQSFERALADEAIKNTSIVFIEKERLIWTQGIMFGGESTHAKGFFSSVDDLQYGEEGDWAIVKEGDEWYIYYFRDGLWNKGDKYNESLNEDILTNYVTKEALIDCIKNGFDNTYVRRDEVYTPDMWQDGEYTPGEGGEYNPGNGGGSSNSSCDCSSQIKNVILNQDQYDALTTYEPNTIYFILKPTQQWTFGGTFPVTFSAEGIGTFPITLT